MRGFPPWAAVIDRLSNVTVAVATVVMAIVAYLAYREVPVIVAALVPEIAWPEQNAALGHEVTAHGTLRHGARRGAYPLVYHPDGAIWNQGPARVEQDGTWQAPIRIGTINGGCGQSYSIRMLVTDADLPPGRVRDLPPDARLSAPVTVRRADC